MKKYVLNVKNLSKLYIYTDMEKICKKLSVQRNVSKTIPAVSQFIGDTNQIGETNNYILLPQRQCGRSEGVSSSVAVGYCRRNASHSRPRTHTSNAPHCPRSRYSQRRSWRGCGKWRGCAPSPHICAPTALHPSGRTCRRAPL